LFCVSITLEVGVASLIIVGHRGEGGFMGEFKGGGVATGVGEAVDLRLSWLSWVVIGFRRGGGRWHR